jgi:hypothetical protein
MFFAMLLHAGLFAVLGGGIALRVKPNDPTQVIGAERNKLEADESKRIVRGAICGALLGLGICYARDWVGGRYGDGNEFFPANTAAANGPAAAPLPER